MATNFYDRVAKKFGGYSYGTNKPNYIKEYSNGDPESVFKEKLIKLAGSEKNVLDVGCGDCKFAFGISENFEKIVGIDTSSGLLKIAKEKQKYLKIKNVSFSLQDAEKTNLKNEFFDVIYCRRGPRYLKESWRLLKKGGYYIEVGIGEKDTKDIQKIFDRGQNYGGWDESRLKKISGEAASIGFKVIFAKDYFYNEYYKSFKDMDIFLQGVPIFEDYDSEKDKNLLIKYADKFKTEKGIKLPRHRIVFVFQKPV